MAASDRTARPKAAFVYMVRCTGGQLYTGWTNDPAARLRAHRSGRGARYTRAHGAEGFAYLERCADRCAALRREAALKKLPKAQKELLCAAWQAAGRPFAEHGAGNAGLSLVLNCKFWLERCSFGLICVAILFEM